MCTFLDRFGFESHQWFVCTWQTNHVVERFISHSFGQLMMSEVKRRIRPLKHLKGDFLRLHTNATNQIIQTCNKLSIQILTANKSVNCCIRKLKKKTFKRKKNLTLCSSLLRFFYFIFLEVYAIYFQHLFM